MSHIPGRERGRGLDDGNKGPEMRRRDEVKRAAREAEDSKRKEERRREEDEVKKVQKKRGERRSGALPKPQGKKKRKKGWVLGRYITWLGWLLILAWLNAGLRYPAGTGCFLPCIFLFSYNPWFSLFSSGSSHGPGLLWFSYCLPMQSPSFLSRYPLYSSLFRPIQLGQVAIHRDVSQPHPALSPSNAVSHKGISTVPRSIGYPESH